MLSSSTAGRQIVGGFGCDLWGCSVDHRVRTPSGISKQASAGVWLVRYGRSLPTGMPGETSPSCVQAASRQWCRPSSVPCAPPMPLRIAVRAWQHEIKTGALVLATGCPKRTASVHQWRSAGGAFCAGLALPGQCQRLDSGRGKSNFGSGDIGDHGTPADTGGSRCWAHGSSTNRPARRNMPMLAGFQHRCDSFDGDGRPWAQQVTAVTVTDTDEALRDCRGVRTCLRRCDV